MLHVPCTYFVGFSIRFTTSKFTTRWIDLQVGIALGFTVSPILFVMAIQAILEDASCYVLGQRLNDEGTLPLLRAFLDDTTILTKM